MDWVDDSDVELIEEDGEESETGQESGDPVSGPSNYQPLNKK